jgi:hypothetical protein
VTAAGRPPRTPEPTSRRGAGFAAPLAVGGAAVAYGGWLVLSRVENRAASFAALLLGLVVAHDLVVVPVTGAIGRAIRRRGPRAVRGALAGAVATSAIVVAFATPFAIGRAERHAANPSFLVRDPIAGAAIVVAAVWATAALVVVRRRDRRGRP